MRIYGIDLGTTYSSIGYVDEYGQPVVIRNSDEGRETTPSVVFFETENNVVVGQRAKNASKLYPDSVVAFIKRDMGQPEVFREHFGQSYRPEDISALILKKLVADAKIALGDTEEIKKVFITCPAYFGVSERSATKAAGELAGLEVVDIINEPTAAALFYSSRNQDQAQNVLVYDLGGGTFDVTVIKLGANVEVKYTGGDHQLGGKDWDQRLLEHMTSEIQRALPHKGSPENNADTMQALFNQAEELKKNLTLQESTMAAVSHEGETLRIDITRAQFEQMTSDLLEQTIQFTRTAIEESRRLGVDHIDKILLVGGSSRMPQVATRLAREFNIPTQMFEPDLAVVKGAAIRAHGFQPPAEGQIDKPPIRDVCSRSLGIQTQVGDTPLIEVTHLIHAQQPLPAEYTQRCQTVKDNQTSIHIAVMEQAGAQESAEIADNKLIGEGFITKIPPGLPRLSPVDVTFQLLSDGMLHVQAVEPRSGQKITFELKIAGSTGSDALQIERIENIRVA